MMRELNLTTRDKLIILTGGLASLLEIIDTSIVNVAIPTMMGNLGATLDQISWVITGYIIANAIVLPMSGWLSEVLGRKFYYTSCIVLFTAASAACGMAPNLTFLVMFRVIQGFAGGALLPTSQTIIYESFPQSQAGMASAIYGMSVMIGPTFGPILGGYLTDNLGWRSIFYINLPIGIIVALLSYLLVEDVGFDPEEHKAKKAAMAAEAAAREAAGHPPEPAPKRKLNPLAGRKRQPIDSMGIFLLILGIGSVQFFFERGRADDWFSSKWICLTAATGFGGLAMLIWWELKGTRHPILQLRHFLNTTFRDGIILMFALGCMLYGLLFLIPVFVQRVTGLDATQTGLLFMPAALASATIMPFIGKQLEKHDARILIAIGILGLSSAVIWISHFDINTSFRGMIPPLMLRGAAMACLFVPINTVVVAQFRGKAIGEAVGMLNLMRQLGGSVGIAIFATLFQNFDATSYNVLSQHVTWFSPVAVAQFHAIAHAMHAKLITIVGMSPAVGAAVSKMAAIKSLYGIVHEQSFILGFQRLMLTAALLFLFVLIPLSRLKGDKHRAPKPAREQA